MDRLMIVEDEKMIRQGIRAMVERSGVPIGEIIECKNGEEALEVLLKQRVDVMITDIRMPRMDGITLVKRSKECAFPPETVVISGYDDFSYAVELLRQGVREYILKPVEREKVTAILKVLEDEIEEQQEDRRDDEKILMQQIKYVLLNPDISDEELEIIERKHTYLFFERPYRVVCTNGPLNFYGMEEVLWFHDVEKQEVFILSANQLERFRGTILGHYAGMSREHIGISSLQKAYREAFCSRKWSFCMEKPLVEYGTFPDRKHFCESEKLESVGETLDGDEISRIVQLAGGQDIKESEKELNYIIYRAKRGEVSPVQLEEAMENLVDQLYRTYKNVTEMDQEGGERLKELFTWPTATEYYEAFALWIEQFHMGMRSKLEDYKNKQKIQEALEYIQKHYTKDLNMAVVSNYVSMNYSLFSFTFKQYTGMNFVYYLKKIRIDEAKRLLKNTDLKVADIAQKVGYDNEKYFMKTFKSVCGVSATEYRRNANLK